MSKNIIIKGTLILTITGFLTKLLGFYNRIFLTRHIGVRELGIYQLIFPIYMLAISFCCQGVSTALTKHVSYYMGRNEKHKAYKILFYGLILSLSFSIIFMLIIQLFSKPISLYILKNINCCNILKIIAFALPFVAIKGCINAFFIGDGNSAVQGISHFVEQLARVFTAYLLVYLDTSVNADASLATIAVITGEIISGILSIIIFSLSSKGNDTSFSQETLDNSLLKSYLQDAIPITSNGLIFTLFASLESIMLPSMLYNYYQNSNFAMELYGIITGIVIPFLLFPATITTALSTMLLPAISNAKAKSNYNKIQTAIFLCVGFCLILGVITFIGYIFLGQWACEFAFKSLDAGIILTKMCFLCPFIYICGVLSTILNGLDKAFFNMLINISGLIIRILFVLFFVPEKGLNAYILGMFFSYITMLFMMSILIKKALKHFIASEQI